jgi:ParB-like chromosome segregation protein Spo0J
MQATMKTVPLDAIQRQDKTYVITSGRSVGQLIESIRAIGIINPPHLVFSTTSGSYQIVCGFRRIEALAQLGYPQVQASVFEPPADERELLLFALQDNIGHRDFNPIEQAEAVSRLCRYFGPDEVARIYLPLLGLPATMRAVEESLALGKADGELKQAVAQGIIHPRTALRLAEMQPGDRNALFGLLTSANLSASKQSEIIEACEDLARREQIPIAAVVQDQAVRSVLRHEKLTSSQKGDQIRHWLRGRRFPRLASCEQRFARARRELRLPVNMQLQPPPFFEGTTYRLQITMEKRADIATAAHELQRLAASPALGQLLEKDG